MTEKGGDSFTLDETQYKEAVHAMKLAVAEKLTKVLGSWDSLSKEDLRRRITLIRDELVGNSDTENNETTKLIVDVDSITAEKQVRLDETDEMVFREVVHATERAKTKVAYNKLSRCGGVKVDVEGAVVLLEEQARKGDSEAMWMLGLCYEFGMGVEQNTDRADSLYQGSYERENVVGEFLRKNSRGERGSGVMSVDCL